MNFASAGRVGLRNLGRDWFTFFEVTAYACPDAILNSNKNGSVCHLNSKLHASRSLRGLRYGYYANGFRFDFHVVHLRFLFFFNFFRLRYYVYLRVSVRLGLGLGYG